MLRNVIIILASIMVVAWNIYVFRNWMKSSFKMKNYSLGLLLLWLLAILIPNTSVILHPFSPVVNGRVIDAASKQPIANCNIKAYWEIESATPQGGHWKTYYQHVTKTDSKGEFLLPKKMKILSNYAPLPLPSYYGGIRIIAFTHGYKYSSSGVGHMFTETERKAYVHPPSVSITMSMEKSRPSNITDDIFSLDYIFQHSNLPSGKTSEDNQYLLDDYRYYYDQLSFIYKNSSAKEIESALIHFASAFKRLGNKDKAIDVYHRLKMEFPESANFADREIEQLNALVNKGAEVSK